MARLLQDEVPPPSPCSSPCSPPAPAAPTRCVSSAGRGSLPCCSAPPSRPAWHRTARLSWDPASYPALLQAPPPSLSPPSIPPPSIPPPLARCPSFQLPNHRRRGEGPQGLGSSKVRAVAVSRLPVSQDLFVCTSIQYPHIYSQKAGRISESYIFLLCFAVRGYNRAAAPAL